MMNHILENTRNTAMDALPYEKAVAHSRRFNAIRWCIFLSGLSVFAQLYLFQPILPQVGREFGVLPAQASFLVSFSTIGMAAGLFILAFIADMVTRRQLMSFSLISSAIVTILSVFVNDFDLLIVVNFIKGMLLSGVSAVALAYIAEEVNVSIIGMAVSLYLSGNIFGGMSGRVIAALVSGVYNDWHPAVLVIGVESLVLGILFWKLFPESHFFLPQKVDIKSKLAQMGRFLNDAVLLRLYVVAALLMGAFVSVYNYLSFRLEQPPFNLPHHIIAYIFLMYTIGMFGAMFASKESAKVPLAKIIRINCVVCIIALAMMAADSIWLTVAGLGLFTFFYFGASAIVSRMVSQRAAEGKSAATSLYFLFYYIGSSVVGSTTGMLVAHGNWVSFIISLAVLFAVSFFLVWGKMGAERPLR